jgi:hypothetical protein
MVAVLAPIILAVAVPAAVVAEQALILQDNKVAVLPDKVTPAALAMAAPLVDWLVAVAVQDQPDRALVELMVAVA